jgi:hypothetical protein
MRECIVPPRQGQAETVHALLRPRSAKLLSSVPSFPLVATLCCTHTYSDAAPDPAVCSDPAGPRPRAGVDPAQRQDRKQPSGLAGHLQAPPRKSRALDGAKRNLRPDPRATEKARLPSHRSFWPIRKRSRPTLQCCGRSGERPRTHQVRTDMDARPVTENTGLTYANKVKVKRADGSQVGFVLIGPARRENH